jgi:Cysteine-rich CPXCG
VAHRLQPRNWGPLRALRSGRCGMLSQSMESGFQCAACGEWNANSVDESAGRRQSYVEDCQVCCKPNLLHIEYDSLSQKFFITAELE